MYKEGNVFDKIFSNEDIAGLHFGDGVLGVVCVRQGLDGGMSVSQIASVEFESDATDADYVRLIRTLWKTQGIKTRMVCIGMQSPRLCLKPFRYTDVDRTELETVLELEAETSLDLPPDEFVFDWHLNASQKAGVERGVEVLQGMLVATNKSLPFHLAKIVRKAGLLPVGVDVSNMAICRLFLAIRGDEVDHGQAICIVSISESSTDISVLFSEHYIYTRTILTKADAWSQKLDYLLNSISDALLYYSQLSKISVRRIVLMGAAADKDYVVDLVQQRFDVPVERWSPLENGGLRIHQNQASVLDKDHISVFNISLGLALRSFNHV